MTSRSSFASLRCLRCEYGVWPLPMWTNTQPNAQTSPSIVYSLRSTISGAMYGGVP